jgi:surface polysaccharide O-acyltransferase-like enzyme
MRNDAFIHLKGVLNRPYYHFGFLRLIEGLYLLTPVLRVILAHAKRGLLKYSLLLWLAGTTIVSVLAILACDNVSGNVFLITEWLGYFVLDAYIVGIHWSSLPLYIAAISGYLCTIIGTLFRSGLIGERVGQFFHDANSITIIAPSTGLFMLLSAVPPSNLEEFSCSL